MENLTLTLAEVAQTLNRQPNTLARSWRKLHRDHGFPRPLPGLGLTWSRAQVAGWIECGGAWPDQDTAESTVARQQADLRARYVRAGDEREGINPQRSVA